MKTFNRSLCIVKGYDQTRDGKMKCDLHVHSRYSKRASTWLMQRAGCAESYTEPIDLYRFARQRGMDAVTVTDHNCIQGCLDIIHLPNVFISSEITSYFPKTDAKVHILVYDITEKQFEEINRIRKNVFDLVAFLRSENITHALSHPFYRVNDIFDIDHFEKCLLLFDKFEISGDIDVSVNHLMRQVIDNLDQNTIQELSDRHGIEPACDKPWQKSYIGGSDDHSSLNIAFTYTQVVGAKNVNQFIDGIEKGRTVVRCPHPANPNTFAHAMYGVAYQYYYNKFGVGRYRERSLLVRFLDRMLHTQPMRVKIWNRMVYHWRNRKTRKRDVDRASITELIQYEAQRMIEEDPQLKSMLKLGHASSCEADMHWFRFVNEVGNRMLAHLGAQVVKSVYGGNPFNMFQTLGSAGALYTLLSPYFVSYSMYCGKKKFSRKVAKKFNVQTDFGKDRISVGLFTDTFHEINGVAKMLQEELTLARKMGKDLTVITCPTDQKCPNQPGLKYFDPVGVHSIPEYPEVKAAFPPLLSMMHYCYEQGFTHIHAATPGPIGLAAIVIAKVLKLGLFTTYHTAIPQYAKVLTGDRSVEGLAWRYMLWFYDQADVVFSPSKSTAAELIEKGIDFHKIKIIPRGVDTRFFSPEKKLRNIKLPDGIKFLYVGRVSKEKDLPLLVEAFKKLNRTRKDVNLIVVGEGPYLEQMKNELEGFNVLFPGYLKGDDLAGVFAQSDLFVFPSTTDTFGNVVLEAQASGLPLIVTDKGGPCENMIDSKTGIIIPGADQEALYTAMLEMIKEPKKLSKMGKNAYEYASKRDYHRAFGQYWQMYQMEKPAGSKRNIMDVFSDLDIKQSNKVK